MKCSIVRTVQKLISNDLGQSHTCPFLTVRCWGSLSLLAHFPVYGMEIIMTSTSQDSYEDSAGKACESPFINGVVPIFVTVVIVICHLFHASRNHVITLPVVSMSNTPHSIFWEQSWSFMMVKTHILN